MACGCDSNMGCDCTLRAGPGITITGIGTQGDPFLVTNSRPNLGFADTPSLDLSNDGGVITGKVNLGPLLKVADTTSLDLTLAGAGTEASPYTLSGKLLGVSLEPSNPGQILMKKPDGTWGAGDATAAPVGAVQTANGLFGDGSAGSPVRIRAKTYAQWEAVVDAAAF